MPVEFLADEEAVRYGRNGERLSRLVTVRYLGTFLNDPLDVPSEVVDHVAEQLGIADPQDHVIR